jgi:hypothetical protein
MTGWRALSSSDGAGVLASHDVTSVTTDVVPCSTTFDRRFDLGLSCRRLRSVEVLSDALDCQGGGD